MKSKFNRAQTSLIAVATCIASLAIADFAAAQEAAPKEEQAVIVTGTRRTDRSAANTPAPVDVVTAAEITRQATTDTAELVRNLVPSFNINTQSINDAASIVRPANLRGLAADQTLVLLNSKRKNRSAVISFIGGGISNGSQAIDLDTIPAIALKRIEVLRDGASAQYGSDAIAGVINLILKDDANGLEANAKVGSTYAGDGSFGTAGAHIGFPLTENGYINFSAEYSNQDATSRSVQRADAAALRAAGNNAVPNPAQVWGQPKIKYNSKAVVNAKIDLSDTLQFYAFGNYSQKDTDGGFYYRNPNTRGGVYSNDGGITRLVGNLDTSGGHTCPVVTIGAANEAAQIAAVNADPKCFMWISKFPGGFTPRFGGKVTDTTAYAGFSGKFGELNWEISTSHGESDVEFHIRNTINSSLGPNSPTSFKPGEQKQTDKSFDFDLNFPIEVKSFASPINVATGYQWRSETFQLMAGDAASWNNTSNLVAQGFSIGSNGFNGFSPIQAGKWTRENYALYIDAEADLTDKLTASAAARYEDFGSDGDSTTYKVGGLYRLTDNFTARSTYSTGFRQPTPGQANVINTTTSFVGGQLTNTGTIPPTSVLGQFLGAKPLKPETSKNFTIGGGYKAGKLSMTLDYFNIKVEDRIGQRGPRPITQAQVDAASAATRAELIKYGALDSAGQLLSDLTNFNFFANVFSTETQGIDFVASYPLEMFGGRTNLTFAFNHTETEITQGYGNLDASSAHEIEHALPEDRATLTATRNFGKFFVLGRVNYFGKYIEDHADDATIPIYADSQYTFDTEVSYELNDNLTFTLGANNLFDSYPTRNPWDFILGAKYPVTAPGGFNGGSYYLRVSFKN